MRSMGVYFIDLGWLGFLTDMPKIKKKEALDEKSKNNNLCHSWETD